MSIRSQIMQAIDANPGLPDYMLARKVAADVGEPALIQLATERIQRVIAGERRKRIREIEAEVADILEPKDPSRWAMVDALLEEYRQAVIVEWTAELLESEFAVGDGRRVTWGTATLGDHVARVGMLTRNVRGNLDAIRRHEAAIATITESKTTTLAEAVNGAR